MVVNLAEGYFFTLGVIPHSGRVSQVRSIVTLSPDASARVVSVEVAACVGTHQ